MNWEFANFLLLVLPPPLIGRTMYILCSGAKELRGVVDFFGPDLKVASVPPSSWEYDVLTNTVQCHLINLVIAFLFLSHVEAFLDAIV
jgi:hypothetical protein